MSQRTPLALLPGLLCDGALWRHQIADLEPHADCRVADLSTQDSVAAMAQSVLQAMPDRFALTGLSMGGYVALEVMRQAPERVTHLALLDTKARPDTPEQTTRRKDLLALAERGQFRGVTPRLMPLLIHRGRLEDVDLTEVITKMAEGIGKAGFLRQQTAIMTRPDSRPTLVTINCPTLVLCGRQDALTPVDCHMEMAAGIASARLEVLEDCGHLAPLERPDAVSAALRRWLTAS